MVGQDLNGNMFFWKWAMTNPAVNPIPIVNPCSSNPSCEMRYVTNNLTLLDSRAESADILVILGTTGGTTATLAKYDYRSTMMTFYDYTPKGTGGGGASVIRVGRLTSASTGYFGGWSTAFAKPRPDDPSTLIELWPSLYQGYTMTSEPNQQGFVMSLDFSESCNPD